MPVPTRPTTGGPVESSWGQEVHDASFAPAGGRWHSQSASIGDSNDIALVADEDPGGWLAAAGNTFLTVPADGDGIYALAAQLRPQTVEANRLYRFSARISGATVAGSTAYITSTVSDWWLPVTGLIKLAAGNTVALYLPGGTGTGRFSLTSLILVRVGNGFGVA